MPGEEYFLKRAAVALFENCSVHAAIDNTVSANFLRSQMVQLFTPNRV